MPQYPDLSFLNEIAPVIAASQAGRMTYDANEMARQQAVERELANAKAAQMNPLQVQYQGLVNQDAESRLPSTKANAILDTLKAEQGIANQPRALEEARFNLNTLPQQKKQEFLKRLPQTAAELRMIPPAAHGNYVRQQAKDFGFDPVALDAYLSNTKDLPSALEDLHKRMSLNAPANLQMQEQLTNKANAAYEKQLAVNEAMLAKELLRQERESQKIEASASKGNQVKNLEQLMTQLIARPDFDNNPEVQAVYARTAKAKLALEQAKLNETGAEIMGTTKPTERAAQGVSAQTPLANKPAGQNVQDNVTMDVQTKILQSNKLDPNKYRVIIKDGRYQAVPK